MSSYDRRTGTTERVSVGQDGRQANDDSFLYPGAISADGRFVVFGSDASNLILDGPGVYLRDRQAGTADRLDLGLHNAQPSSASFSPSISPDGSFVAFVSEASNLIRHDSNRAFDVFVRPR